MANICDFSMRVKGTKENIDKFYNALRQKGNVWIGRGTFDTDIQYEPTSEIDIFYADIYGGTKWSIYSSLIHNAISMRTEPDTWYWGENKNPNDYEFITLWEACEKYSLDMEVYSSECGCAFQEHFMYVNGKQFEECVDYYEFDVEEYDTKEEAEEDLGETFTDEEWNTAKADDNWIKRGGYEEWIFSI